jgi:hypothetical protein
MSMQIFTFDQGTPEWFAARLGIPTASEFATVMAKGKGGGESKTRRTYLLKLAGELMTGEPAESFTNAHMERGKIMEDEARNYYAFRKNTDPQRVGFIRNGDKGCSPDSLLDNGGMLEIKTTLPHLLIDKLLSGEFPPEHKAQCQGQLWVSERDWIDICVYWPKLPPLIVRAARDNGYIAQMAGEIARFNDELQTVVETIRKYGAEAKAA